jgi:hypothetical protein
VRNHTFVPQPDKGGNVSISPIVIGNALLLPRLTYWPEGHRAEILISDDALGDIVISDFFKTREEAERWSERAMLQTAERYVTA